MSKSSVNKATVNENNIADAYVLSIAQKVRQNKHFCCKLSILCCENVFYKLLLCVVVIC